MRRFFGGGGAFHGSTLFAMAMGQTLYPRVDDASRAVEVALAERWLALVFSAVAERWWNGAEESRADRA